MYALASDAAGTLALPYFHLGALGPIQSFGLIVAVGVLIGASVLRRYAEWHGISDDHIRGILAWVTIAGFLGAHEFDMLFYNWDKIGEATNAVPPGWWPLGKALWVQNWPLPFRIWEGISSYGGFLGGAIGWWIYVFWKRLPMRLMADVTVIGLLVAFSIGRIGCTVVSDHIGAAVDPNQWYSFLAMDYPRRLNPGDLAQFYPGTSEYIRAWNLGLLEFLYLVPVNLLMLWYAFRPSKRPNAGMITAITGMLYAPVRFLLDFWRVNPEADPRYLGLTFAQWVSILAFGAAVALAIRIKKTGKPADTIATTSGEAQAKLKVIFKESVDEARAEADKKKSSK